MKRLNIYFYPFMARADTGGYLMELYNNYKCILRIILQMLYRCRKSVLRCICNTTLSYYI